MIDRNYVQKSFIPKGDPTITSLIHYKNDVYIMTGKHSSNSSCSPIIEDNEVHLAGMIFIKAMPEDLKEIEKISSECNIIS